MEETELGPAGAPAQWGLGVPCEHPCGPADGVGEVWPVARLPRVLVRIYLFKGTFCHCPQCHVCEPLIQLLALNARSAPYAGSLANSTWFALRS